MTWIGYTFNKIIGANAAGHPDAPPLLRRVRNLTQGTELADRLELAGESAARTKGLLGRDALAPGQGLWILPCEGVHTFWMRFPIDLVYLDRRSRVRKVRHAVGPWRISLCLTAHSILELPAGTARASLTQRGDQLEIVPVADDSATEPASCTAA